jgi:hypothetical protein
MNGFVDVSGLLSGGVYLLVHRGAVVYVGRASGAMLPKLAALRGDMPKWFPRIKFDQVLIRPCHPDQISRLAAALIAEHRPKHNIDHLVSAAPITLERRL